MHLTFKVHGMAITKKTQGHMDLEVEVTPRQLEELQQIVEQAWEPYKVDQTWRREVTDGLET